MLNKLIYSFALFLSLSGFAQEEIKEPLSPGGGRVIIRGQSAPSADPVPEAVRPSGEEAIIEDALNDRDKQLKKIQKVQKIVESPKDDSASPEGSSDLQEELKNAGYDGLSLKAMTDEKVLALLQKQLREADLTKLSNDEAKRIILQKSQGSIWGSLFEGSPATLNTAAEIVRDKNALLGLVNIFVRKKDLKTYGYVVLVIFVFSLFFKRRVVKPEWNFGRRFLWNFTINIILSVISLSIFYSLFREEISPVLSIIGRNFF